MFNNYYNPQMARDRIDNQIAQLQQMKEQIPQTPMQPAINQTFQLAPSTSSIKYADNIDEVQKDLVIGDTPYFSKDMSIVWIKNIKGEIKAYELNEIIEKDAKDLQIELLTEEINKLKGMVENESINANDITTKTTTNTTGDDDTNGTTTKKDKSTNVSKVSGSKTK
jgi:hypothetical protein